MKAENGLHPGLNVQILEVMAKNVLWTMKSIEARRFQGMPFGTSKSHYTKKDFCVVLSRKQDNPCDKLIKAPFTILVKV